MKKYFIIIAFTCAQILFGQWTGSGTSGDPYQIGSVSDLVTLANNVNAGNTYTGVYFKQTTSLNLGVAPYNSGDGWMPIGVSYMGEFSQEYYYFNGNYDGNGNSISNLFIARPDSEYVGLFGCCNAGSISNLNLVNVDVTGNSQVGGLAGLHGGSITNCTVTGTVAAVLDDEFSGGRAAGLLVGWNYGTISYCSTEGSISCENQDVGGLVGDNTHGGTIDNCSSDAAVTDGNGAGGLVGSHTHNGYTSVISNSFAAGNVSCSGDNYVGGLVGYSDANINDCYSTGSVSADDFVGGLVGQLSGTVTDCYAEGNVSATTGNGGYYGGAGGLVGQLYSGGTINTSYATGTVTATYTAGGLVGDLDYDLAESFINNSYARGAVSGFTAGSLIGYFGYGTATNCYGVGAVTGVGDGNRPGGFAGYLEHASWGIASNCFWDTQTTGKSTGLYNGDMTGVTGKTTSEMKTQSTFTTWDFTTTWEIYPSDGANYPRLRTNTDPALPVELVSFTVSVAGNAVELRWTTATELNNHGFEVERKELNHRLFGSLNQSADESMNQWNKIGFIEGHGTTNAPKSYTFVDGSASGTVAYRLKQIDRDGKFTYSQEAEIMVGEMPNVFVLEQNYPNPFNPTTTIGFTLEKSGMTTLKIYDAIGREVATLVEEVLEAGIYHQKSYTAKNLSSGLYFMRLQSGNNSQIRKLLLMK